MGRLGGKYVVIIGAGGGIGSAITELFAAEGATLAIGDLRPVQLPEQAAGPASFSRITDATRAAQVTALVDEAAQRWGHVDVLVNNAGRRSRGSVLDVEEPEFDDVMATNLKSAYLGCRAVLPHMLSRRRGSVINMSSNGGLEGRAGDPVYVASKHAVVGLTKSLALAYARENIRVNTICPGPIDTPMLRGQEMADDADFAARLPRLVASCPAGRVGQATDIAAAALFLASDESTFINGIALPVDGAKSAGIMPIDRYNTAPELFS